MPSAPFKDGDQVFIRMLLKNGKENDTPQDLKVMANHIMDFYFTEAQGKAATFSLKLYDENFDSLEDVIFGGEVLNPKNEGSPPVIQVQWGWINADGEVLSPPWDMRITKYRSRFILGQGMELDIEGWSSPGILSRRGNLTAAKDSPLSSLVQRIADRNNLLVDVEDGEIILEVRQNGMNDLMWLKNVVQYAVKSDSGNRNYEVWIRNRGLGKSELVVRTQKTSLGSTTWDYLYAVDRDGQVLEFEVEIKSNYLFAMGAGGFRTVVFDPKTKQAKEFITNSRSTPGVAGEGKFIPVDSTTPAPLRLGFQNEESAIAYAASKYLQLNHTNTSGRLRIHGNPLINPSDLVNIILLRGAQGIRDIRDIHPTSGFYQIKSVSHNITDGNYTTEIELFRRGNLTPEAGGSEKTTGTEAATNQVRKASDVISGAYRKAKSAQREKFIANDRTADAALKAKLRARGLQGN